jgi:citrate lyase subunit beta/citryl-CoA lyase
VATVTGLLDGANAGAAEVQAAAEAADLPVSRAAKEAYESANLAAEYESLAASLPKAAKVTTQVGEAVDAVASGFAATACIHPRHVAVIREAYAPTAAEVARAEQILAAAAGHEAGGGAGVFALDGVMVDEPVLRHARAVLARAGG